ncbi:MAG: hypothetical protein GY834_12615 [Bacteroidetes bacterium]|nr:hypothetical protein [Bacteroidota bacterium]
MARYERHSIEQGEFLSINIEDQFDNNSREYHIKNFIDRHVEMKMFEEHYKNDETGRKGKHPKDMISAILYGYITGNRASRNIEEYLQTHIGFMYVANRLRVDHSVICDFKNRFNPIIEELFARLLFILNNLGEVDWDIVVGDGTKIKANAGKGRNVGGEITEKKLNIYRKMSKKIIERDLEVEENHNKGILNDKKYHDEKKRISRQKKLYDRMVDKIEDYQEHVDNNEIDGKVQHNLTDPDSKVMPGSDKRTFIQGYNAKFAICNNDIILDYTSDTESEKNSGDKIIKSIEEKKKELKVEQKTKYLMDSGFEDMRTILRNEKDGIDVYIDVKERSFSKDAQKRKFFSEPEKRGDEYYISCVGGRTIKGSPYKDSEMVSFSFIRKGCEGCFNYGECYKKIKKTTRLKNVNFDLIELENRDEINKYLKKLRSDEGQKIYHKRIGKEHVFANIKTQKGYYQTAYRGYKKVNMELSWIALAHNLMKYVNYKSSFATG